MCCGVPGHYFFCWGSPLSYQVIARKWRPKDFEEVVGQSHITQTLLNALKHDRLHHALLFTGPRGTGKTSTARVLAKTLRCPDDPEGLSKEAQDIAQGRSLNVIEIDGASNNGVDAVRELRESVGYMPSSGRHKIYIIDEVHMLSTAAFNALLKTLEEPPPHVIFIMATTEVHKIPVTILSRTQRFDFRRISMKIISDHLQKICDAEQVQIEPEALWILAKQSEGSMRDAQSLLDQMMTFAGISIGQKEVIEVLGLTDRLLLTKTLESIVRSEAKKLIEHIEAIFEAGYDPKLFLRDLLEEIRHVLLIKVGQGQASKMVDLPEIEFQSLKKLSTLLSEEDLQLLFDMAMKGAQDVHRSQDPQVVLEVLLLRMAQAPRIDSLEKLFAGFTASSQSLSMSGSVASVSSSKATNSDRSQSDRVAFSAPSSEKARPPNYAPSGQSVEASSPPPQAEFAPQSEREPSRLQSSGESSENPWVQFVKRVKAVNPIMGAKLDHCVLIRRDEDQVVLGLSPKMAFMKDKVFDPEFQRKISNYLNTFWGKPYSIVLEEKAEGETAKSLADSEEQKKWEDLRKKIEEHPFVKATKAEFQTSIKSIKETKQ